MPSPLLPKLHGVQASGQVVCPMLFCSIPSTRASRFAPSPRSLTLNVRKMFQEIDAPLYERCRLLCEEEEAQVGGGLEGCGSGRIGGRIAG